MSNLVDIIKKIVGDQRIYSVVCNVESVDITARTAMLIPLNEEAPYHDSRLQANLNMDNGILIIPVVGSNVIATPLNSAAAFISLFSEIERIEIKIGATTVELTDQEVTINGGQNNGLVKVLPLVSQLNAIKNDINTLKAVFNSWVTVGGDGGAALKAAAAVWSAQNIATTQQSDLENNKVTH